MVKLSLEDLVEVEVINSDFLFIETLLLETLKLSLSCLEHCP